MTRINIYSPTFQRKAIRFSLAYWIDSTATILKFKEKEASAF